MMRNRALLRAQRGNSLFMALVILGMVTLLAVTNFRLSETTAVVTGNFQHEDAVLTAANSVIQEAISTVRMVQTPTAIFPNPCNNVPNSRCLDLNADGTADVTVRITPAPTCIQAKVLPVNDLDLSDDEDRGCMTGVASGTFGVAGAPSADSLCANTLFEVNAVATDSITEAAVRLSEGVAVRVTTDDVDTACP